MLNTTDLFMTTTTDASARKDDDESSYVMVLTGASGYLGQHFLQRLLDRSASSELQMPSPWQRSVTVHALQAQPRPELATAIQAHQDQLSFKKDGAARDSCPITIVTHTLDITCADAVSNWMDTHFNDSKSLIHCCIHTAAISSPAVCQQDSVRAMAVNVPEHLFSALLAHNPALKIIALSTDQVYRGDELWSGSSKKDNCATAATASTGIAPHFYTESHPANEPVNAYGQSKRALEDYLLQQHNKNQTNTVVLLRSSILLGPLAPFVPAHDTFLHFCRNRAQDNKVTTYYTNEVRSVLAVHDAVGIMLRLADPTTVNMASGVYCMGGPHAVSRHDMAVAVLQHCGYPLDLAVPAIKRESAGTAAVPSPLNIAMDSSRLWQLLFNHQKQPMSLTDIVAQTFPNIGSI
jgi:dTDP-4-dehydrorhamnose reductase